jgi:hypothetical protein
MSRPPREERSPLDTARDKLTRVVRTLMRRLHDVKGPHTPIRSADVYGGPPLFELCACNVSIPGSRTWQPWACGDLVARGEPRARACPLLGAELSELSRNSIEAGGEPQRHIVHCRSPRIGRDGAIVEPDAHSLLGRDRLTFLTRVQEPRADPLRADPPEYRSPPTGCGNIHQQSSRASRKLRVVDERAAECTMWQVVPHRQGSHPPQQLVLAADCR